MAGVGKTQIVIEYAYRNMDQYKAVWWIRSEEPAILASDYAALSEKIGVMRDEKDQSKTIEAVRHWLEYNRGWLLIFDNAVKAEDLERYLPRAGSGHVMITSRNPFWGGIALPMEIKVFHRPESIQLIQNRTKQHDGSDDLAEAMGNLPLALDQASAYIEERAISIRDYLERFRKHRLKALERGRSATYTQSIAVALDVACQAVAEKSSAAIQLLWICSFLAPERIPRSLFIEGFELLPEPLASAARDELEFDDIITALRSYSLIKADAKNISVHRLVQLLTREHLAEDDQKRWAEISFKLIDATFPEESDTDVGLWETCSVLLPHALASISHAEELRADITSHLIYDAGVYLYSQSEFQEAKISLERAIKVDEQAHGLEHADLARDVNRLGMVLIKLDELQEARKCIERALTISEKIHEPDHVDLVRDVNSFGIVLKELGEPQEARKCFERSLKICEKVYEPDHTDVAGAVNNLGSVLQDLGELQEARKCFERSLKISEKVHGPDHVYVGKAVNNLGSVLRDLDELQEARKCFERSLKICEKVYGPDHTEVATPVNNLGSVLLDLGELQKARKCFERSLKISEKVYGPDHTEVATAVNNLGMVLRDLGELHKARKCFDRSLKISEKVYGPDHTVVARDLNNLGMTLFYMGYRLGAIKHVKRALNIYKKTLGQNHPTTKNIRKNLRIIEFF